MIARLPLYLRYLRERLLEGQENVSSAKIAEDLRLNGVQVRKDFALVSRVSGRPKLGFEVKELIESIEIFLGCNNASDALLVGAGGLGSTLMSYGGFKNYGLNIVAAFDSNPKIINTKINNIPILSLAEVKSVANRLNIKMGIITVPVAAAQSVADMMVEAGILAIWNFAPTHLILPTDIIIKHEDLAASLAVLSKKLSLSTSKE